jgi:phosphatidylethanolamine-binding protein (PEBP) family uncharacterized protein
LIIEDPDAPTRAPFVHCVSLIDALVTSIPAGGLSKRAPAPGIHHLRSGIGRGYRGPAPIKGHGPHAYVFELFALRTPLGANSASDSVDAMKPRALLSNVSDVIARGRLDGVFESGSTR